MSVRGGEIRGLRYSSALVRSLFALPARAEFLPDLKRGYVIFQNSRSAKSLATLLATDSPFTHVGIVDCDDNGNPQVLEAVRTTRATPLRDRVSHGEGSDVAVYRMHDLSEDQALAVTRAARSHFGMGHDPYVYRTEEALYCGEADSAEACLTLIRDVPLVTPQAMAEDGRLHQVHSSLGDLLRGRSSFDFVSSSLGRARRGDEVERGAAFALKRPPPSSNQGRSRRNPPDHAHPDHK